MKKFKINILIQKISSSLLGVLFLVTIITLGANNSSPLKKFLGIKKESAVILKELSALEKKVNDSFFKKFFFVDLNGLTRRVLGQLEMKGLIRNIDGELFSITKSEPTYKSISNLSKGVEGIYTSFPQIPFLFVQMPAKVVKGKTQLPPSIFDYLNGHYDLWRDIMTEKNIPYLDLRESIDGDIEFYKTDHHWTVRTAFFAAGSIVDRLNLIYDLGLDPDNSLRSINNYKSLKRERSFLGSYGIKVGKYFVGKDDIEIFTPTFDTAITYRHYINDELIKEKKGNFQEALIDIDILNNENYNNKYNACLQGGYVENVIINAKAQNNLKLLFISHSFGRPLAQYISLYFAETRYLDPQKGRYEKSYLEYVRNYRPDVIVVMYNGNIPL